MTISKKPSEISPEENLARYVLYNRHIRKADNTVKADAFIPHPYVDLSVTRHSGLDESNIWAIGADVAQKQGKTLYGRADIQTSEINKAALEVISDPDEGNPNHANVIGWPTEKAAQKNIALEIASKSTYLPAI